MIVNEGLIKPAECHYTTSSNGAVKLRIDSTEHGFIPPLTIPALFESIVEEFPNSVALSFKDKSGEWQRKTYSEYQAKVHHVAKAFIKLGFEPRDAINILAFNCPEWFYAEMGAIYAGGIAAGIYLTNSPEAVFYILSTSNAKILIVDDARQMEKVRQIWMRLPNLKVVVQIHGPFEEDLTQDNGYYKWTDIEEMDTTGYEEKLQVRLDNIAVNECCLMIYTSGTTGPPKAAMLSHDNITWMSKTVINVYGDVIKGDEVCLSYLPMSHVAAQMQDIFLPIMSAGNVYFADQDALKGSLLGSILKCRPTRFMGVPRVYEKIYEKFTETEMKLPIVKKTLLNWAKRTSLQYNLIRMQGNACNNWMHKVAQCLVLNKIKESLGLERVRRFVVGGAAFSPEVKEFFLSIDFSLIELFGLSESTGLCTATFPTAEDLQTVGKKLPGVDLKILNADSNGVGEICARSRGVFMGYLNDLSKTLEAIDVNGWLHTGDLGRIDSDGNLYLTGRSKELIITAGGENIPTALVEKLVKDELPFVSNLLLIGERRKYLVILLTLKTEMDPITGGPLDKLLPEVTDWLCELNLSYTTVSEILEAGPCPIVMKEIQDGIARANERAISNAQKVQKFAILPRDFSQETDELGPTLKLKRNVVIGKYQDVIEKLYQ